MLRLHLLRCAGIIEGGKGVCVCVCVSEREREREREREKEREKADAAGDVLRLDQAWG